MYNLFKLEVFIFNPSRRCDEKLCHTCGEVHRKLKTTKNHKTVKLGSTEAGALVQMWRENPTVVSRTLQRVSGVLLHSMLEGSLQELSGATREP